MTGKQTEVFSKKGFNSQWLVTLDCGHQKLAVSQLLTSMDLGRLTTCLIVTGGRRQTFGIQLHQVYKGNWEF